MAPLIAPAVKILTNPIIIRTAFSLAFYMAILRMLSPRRRRKTFFRKKAEKVKVYTAKKYKENSLRKRMENAGIKVVK